MIRPMTASKMLIYTSKLRVFSCPRPNQGTLKGQFLAKLNSYRDLLIDDVPG